MKNAQAKIDALLEALVNRCEAAVGSLGTNAWQTPKEWREEVEWLIRMSNLNNQTVAKTGRIPAAAPDTEAVSDADLLKELLKGRDPDQFPRRGPRNGKREPVAPTAAGD